MDDHLLEHARVRRGFNLAAPAYDSVAVLQREVGERLFDRLALVSIEPRCVMDLGSGTGVSSRRLRDRYRRARIFHADFAEGMLRHARQRAPRFFSRQSWVCADATALPFAGAFQLVFSNLMLQWCDDPEKIFFQVRGALQQSGLFMFSSFGPDTLRELRQCWAAVDSRTHVNVFLDMHDLGDALLRAGFEAPVMEVERFTLTYTDVISIFRELKQLGASNSTAGRRRSLTGRGRLEQVIDEYERMRHEGRLPVTYEVVYGHAWCGSGETRPAGPGVAVIPVGSIGRRGRGR